MKLLLRSQLVDWGRYDRHSGSDPDPEWELIREMNVDFSSLSAFKRTIHNARLNLYTKY